MFFNTVTLLLFPFFTILAAAMPPAKMGPNALMPNAAMMPNAATVPNAATGPNNAVSQCNTGSLQCCNSVLSATIVTELTNALGVTLLNPNTLVGLTCNPITVIGVGGNGCLQEPVCCTDNSYGGVISIGCLPVTIVV